MRAAALTENYCRLVRSCDAVIADLSDYRGYECSNDVGFECGMGFEMGKKLFAYMRDARPCIEKIPTSGRGRRVPRYDRHAMWRISIIRPI